MFLLCSEGRRGRARGSALASSAQELASCPRTCADLVGSGAAFQKETAGLSLHQTWARLESKAPSLLSHPSFLNGCCGICALPNWEVASTWVAVPSPSSLSITLLPFHHHHHSGHQPCHCSRGHSKQLPPNIASLLYLSCHRMLSSSGTTSFYTTHQARLALMPCILCYVSAPLIFQSGPSTQFVL